MSHSVEEQVEQLFRVKTVEQIREIEIQTRHQVEEKSEQLRQLIGNSYRELLSTSDTVIRIHKTSKDIVESVNGIRVKLQTLADADRSVQHDGSADTPSETNSLYGLGVRVKFLLDTPETVWSCLDVHDFFAAARRYLAAAEAHRALMSRDRHRHGAGGPPSRFPLLQHQWPIVRKFRAEIQTRTTEWLGGEAGLRGGPAALANALAALALLKPLDGEELLRTLLTARRAGIVARLRALRGAPDPEALPGELAGQEICVADTVCSAAQLFCRLPGVSSEPLLASTLEAAADDGAEGPLDTAADAEGGPERRSWRSHVEATLARVAALGTGGVALELGAWLDAMGAAWAGGEYLGAVARADGLRRMEDEVRAAVTGWRGVVGADGPGAPVQLSWDDVALWALGAPRPLWALLLEEAYVGRARALLDHELRSGVDGVAAAMKSGIARVTGTGTGLHVEPGSGALASADVAGPQGAWLATGTAAAGAVAEALDRAAASVRVACDAPGVATPGRDTALGRHLRRGLGAAVGEISKAVARAAEDAAGGPQGDTEPLGALVVGHVAAALARLGADGAGPVARAAVDDTGVREALEALRAAASRALASWARDAAARVADACVAELASDAALSATEFVRSAIEIEVGDATDAGAAPRQELPDAASPAAGRLLFAVATEVDAACLTAVGLDARVAFEGAVAEALAGGMRRWLERGSATRDAPASPGTVSVTGAVELSTQGALQLAFDARLMAAALGQSTAGGAMPPAWARLERTIADRLDPIDWASAVSHLPPLVTASLSRSKLEFGLLTGVARAPAPTPIPVNSEKGVNVLRLVTGGPRCALLPVATPTPIRSSHPATTSADAATAVVPLLRELEADDGQAAHYSFAILSERALQRAKNRAAAGDGAQTASAIDADGRHRAGASRDVGAAALDALRGSKLGTLLGDRAAEMMGDMSFGTGLFSSFTSGLRR